MPLETASSKILEAVSFLIHMERREYPMVSRLRLKVFCLFFGSGITKPHVRSKLSDQPIPHRERQEQLRGIG